MTSGEPPHDVVPLKGIRRVTAERLSAHWTGAPQVTEGVDIDMTEVRAWRTANRDEVARRIRSDAVAQRHRPEGCRPSPWRGTRR